MVNKIWSRCFSATRRMFWTMYFWSLCIVYIQKEKLKRISQLSSREHNVVDIFSYVTAIFKVFVSCEIAEKKINPLRLQNCSRIVISWNIYHIITCFRWCRHLNVTNGGSKNVQQAILWSLTIHVYILGKGKKKKDEFRFNDIFFFKSCGVMTCLLLGYQDLYIKVVRGSFGK